MRRALVLFMLLCALPAAAQEAAGPPPPDFFTLGNERYERGEYDEAIAQFEAGYRAQPDPVYLFNIAQAHRLAHHLAEALASYRRYLDAAPEAENRAAVEGRIAELERGIAAAEVIRLAREGRRLVKAHELGAGLRLLREALRKGEAARLSGDDLADLHYALGLALLRAEHPDEAAAELARAAALSPGDGEIRLDLATALLRGDDYEAAAAAATEALGLGIKGEDRKDAEDLLRKARSERLHDRLIVDTSVTAGFDSNVLQGTQETIGDRFTGAARPKVTAKRAAAAVRSVRDDIINQYTMPSPVRAERDVPVNVYLDVGGRLYGGKRAQLWLEYHFLQTVMTLPRPKTADDPTPYDPYEPHDIYNMQEHRVTLRLRTVPAPWLVLVARAEGFANFTGLRDFTPFQGGITGGIDGTLRETKKLQTRLTLVHQYRAAFDRSVTVDTDLSATCKQTITETDTYTDGNRTDLGLIQELRLPWLRGRLGYQFHSDRTGVLDDYQPYYQTQTGGAETVLGCYTYKAPLSYYGQEALLAARFFLPLKFELSAGARYEYRTYDGSYEGTFRRVPTVANPMPRDIVISGIPRRDHRVVLDVGVHKDLPLGLGVEATYSYTRNLSNIANGIDNRNYDKHVATVWATYLF